MITSVTMYYASNSKLNAKQKFRYFASIIFEQIFLSHCALNANGIKLKFSNLRHFIKFHYFSLFF